MVLNNKLVCTFHKGKLVCKGHSCHTKQFTGKQFQAVAKKKIHSHIKVQVFFLLIIRHCLNINSCATKVVLLHALQLVAFCDKALSLMAQIQCCLNLYHGNSGINFKFPVQKKCTSPCYTINRMNQSIKLRPLAY